MKKNIKIVLVFMLFLLFIAGTSVFYAGVVHEVSRKLNGITIVLDAGHGARDGGSVGQNGTVEKDINLNYTLALRDKLIKNGYKVVLTRSNDEPLYSQTASNKKLNEMQTRLNVIKRANPNLVISIHMNSFPSSNVSGANTYYRKDDESGKTIANYIQSRFHDTCNAPNENAKIGDYFLLNSSYYTCVLIECGFLSNPEEERRLNTNEYKDKIINAIYDGIFLYFGNS